MRVAVLGTGVVGQAISSRLSELGHDVVIGTRDVGATTSRDDFPAGVDVLTYSDAAATGELVVLAVSGTAVFDVLGAAGADNLAGKTLLDISNSLDFSNGFPPFLSVKDTDSVGEQIQAAYPSVNVVKSLNTLAAALMVHPELVGNGDHTVFVSGNDSGAKETVVALLQSFGHRDILDLGDISTCRGPEMYLGLWVRLYGLIGTDMFSLKIVR
ncbi:MAG: NAD(P)-binding domain-containing protein [bacterium]|nr:NAD(P)-binding domain-containing protein [bacterium]